MVIFNHLLRSSEISLWEGSGELYEESEFFLAEGWQLVLLGLYLKVLKA